MSWIRSWGQSCFDKYIKNEVDVNIIDNVYWYFDIVVGADVGKGYDCWVDNDAGDEVWSGEGGVVKI